MAVTRDTGGVGEGLRKLFTEVAQLKLLPDANEHMSFLTTLEGGIMRYLQALASGAAGLGAGGGGEGMREMGAIGGPPSGMPPGPPAAQFQPGGAAGGGSVGLAPNINPNEMQRVLSQAGGVG